ncbi:MAG: hypothetical protein QNJ46_35615 [Leptolyngbyaceae cyanobacterium MO_188.B28]|nr:hypothetical protein [Leptolyngbyaceae cyanobacterium MO_188.B28]
MFKPTHILVSRSRKIPVLLIPKLDRFIVITQEEWEQGQKPAFEMHPKLGFFCRGIAILGHHLETIGEQLKASDPIPAGASA